jgi:hypothetical protein
LVDTGNLPEWWSGNNLSGFLQQFYLLKKQNRRLKVLLSIGGANYSSHFALPTLNSTGLWISTFASSVVSLVNSTGLDGLDIDWQYPDGASQAGNFVPLLQMVRNALTCMQASLTRTRRTTFSLLSLVLGHRAISSYSCLKWTNTWISGTLWRTTSLASGATLLGTRQTSFLLRMI